MTTGCDNIHASIPTYERPKTKGLTSVLDQLLRLDAWARPGLSELEFTDLFAKCRCGLVMTRRVFRDHLCFALARKPSPAVIDLTSDTDDEVAEPAGTLPAIIDLTADSDDDFL